MKGTTGTAMKTVTRYTRAGKRGKGIICPDCNVMTTVYNFAWQFRECRGCGRDVFKLEWYVKPKSTVKPVICALCGRETIYPSQIEHPCHWQNLSKCYQCGFDQRNLHILEGDGEVELRCPYIASGGERCPGVRTIKVSELRGEHPIYHNNLNKLCSQCGQYVDGRTLILNNMDLLNERTR